jgi:hypothetical protein
MPAGAVYVGRPTRWGNPFKVSEYGRADAVRRFDEYLRSMPEDMLEQLIAPLRGKDLACFCPLDAPCHADVLLRLAAENP